MPGEGERLFPPSIDFFHRFPFSRGGKTEEFFIESLKSSPPFEKGRPGGISGKAVSKRNFQSYGSVSPRFLEISFPVERNS